MSDTKMLQAILDGQSSIREGMEDGFGKVNKRIDKLENKLTQRIDKIGKQVAFLEDDAPTRDEFDDLEERVVHLEKAPAN